MTKEELLKVISENIPDIFKYKRIRSAVEAYTSTLLQQTSVSNSLPQRRCFECGDLLDKEELFCEDCRRQ
jgi:hypothetical protein